MCFPTQDSLDFCWVIRRKVSIKENLKETLTSTEPQHKLGSLLL